MVVSLKKDFSRSMPLVAAIGLAFVLGLATAWIAMQAVETDIRAEMRSQFAHVRDDLAAVRAALSDLDGDARKEVAELGRRLVLIEREFGFPPVALPEGGDGAAPDRRPPLPPGLPVRRSPSDR